MEAINWDAVAALSEAFGVFALVGSVIFVGLQIRQGTKAAKIAAVQNIGSEWRNVFQGMANDNQVAEILLRGGLDWSNLTGSELFQFNASVHTFFLVGASAYYQHDNGVLDDETFVGIKNQFRLICAFPGVLDFWASRKESFPKRFQQHFDEEILPNVSEVMRGLYKDEATGSEGAHP